MKIEGAFLETENLPVKIEITMTFAQWERLTSHIGKDYLEPMASFSGTIKRALNKMKEKVEIKFEDNV